MRNLFYLLLIKAKRATTLGNALTRLIDHGRSEGPPNLRLRVKSIEKGLRVRILSQIFGF
jgi:hypothetical protein